MLSDEGDMLWVQAEHMLGGHWWVAVSGVRFHEAEADFDGYRKSSPGRKSPAAIARIAGSAGLPLQRGVAKVGGVFTGGGPLRLLDLRRD